MSAKIQIKSVEMMHEEGTKRYMVCLVTSADRVRSMLIKRWGKLEAHGEWKIEPYYGGESAYEEAIKAKRKRGYGGGAGAVMPETSEWYSDSSIALKWLEGYTSRETAVSVMNFIIPGAVMAGASPNNVISEEPRVKVVDRTGDKEWATW